MLTKNIAFIFAVALFVVSPLYSADKHIDKDKNPQKIEYVVFTEDYPPYSYKENGEIKGSSTEIIKAIFKQLKITNYRILLLDWDLSYDFAQHIPNSIIYSLTKTKERSDKFKWVGPVATNYWYLFANNIDKSVEKINISRLSDANKYKIAVEKQSSIASYLKNKGLNNLVETTTIMQSAKDLLDKNVELWAMSESVAYSIINKLDKPKSILKKIYTLKKRKLYIGFNLKMPDSIVKKFQDTLDVMKKDGTYDTIVNKHYDKIYR
jgi:ABC-type amino acid transport substrate-binding protein